MMKFIFSLIAACTIYSYNLAQEDSYLKCRWNFKLAYLKLEENFFERPSLRFEANYGLLNFMEMGSYVGYKKFPVYGLNSNFGFGMEYTHSPYYGITANFHVFPLFIKKNDFRFDLYLTSRLGGNYIFERNAFYPQHGNHMEYGIGPGAVFYIGKSWGIFVEQTYGKEKILKTGLAFKFKKKN